MLSQNMGHVGEKRSLFYYVHQLPANLHKKFENMRVIIIFYTKFNRIPSKMPSFNIGKRVSLYYFLCFFVTLPSKDGEITLSRQKKK
jgi:hypothetical protein